MKSGILISKIRQASRIWVGGENESANEPRTCLFRRTFELSNAPKQQAQIYVYAELRYHLWINGRYVGRGPIQHHSITMPFDCHDITTLLRPGRNVICALVHTPGMSVHNAVPLGDLGLIAALDIDGETLLHTDSTWRATDASGWSAATPKRCWALGPIEMFDMSIAPLGWREEDFDDSSWSNAQEQTPAIRPAVEVMPSPLPPLRYQYLTPVAPPKLYQIDDAPVPLTKQSGSGQLADAIMKAQWKAPSDVRLSGDLANGTLTIEGISPEHGAIISLDLGKEYVGQVLLTCDCPGEGVIDIGWSEMQEDGRPQLCRKGVSYVDRVLATRGRLDWHPIGFSAARFIVLVFRGFSGPVKIQRINYLESRPALSWTGDFHSNDPLLNDVWQMCRYTLDVGTQEGLMDCPTREQACYVGDGHYVAKWITQITGDARHWKYLIIEQFRRQALDGMIRSTVFSGRSDSLIDYSLIGVMGVRDYLRITGDIETVRKLIDNCRRVLWWFDSRRDADGFFLSNWEPTKNRSFWEYPYTPAEPNFERDDALNLFIDHPGMGWHNVGEAGIDRRGINAAINALLVMGRRALADLEEALGNRARAAELRAMADEMAGKIAKRFLSPADGLFHDGELDGQLLPQVSEQTNTWAIAAGCADSQQARTILLKLLTEDDPSVARNGPYFWTYLFPLLNELDLHQIGCEKIRKAWGKMVDAQSSTLWETFKGDNLDSWCHPWSSAPAEFLLTGILGLPASCLPGETITLRPRYDLISEAGGRIMTAAGAISVAWKTSNSGNVEFEGDLPSGVCATVVLKDGRREPVKGRWKLTI